MHKIAGRANSFSLGVINFTRFLFTTQTFQTSCSSYGYIKFYIFPKSTENAGTVMSKGNLSLLNYHTLPVTEAHLNLVKAHTIVRLEFLKLKVH